jgi:hypothetical protein
VLDAGKNSQRKKVHVQGELADYKRRFEDSTSRRTSGGGDFVTCSARTRSAKNWRVQAAGSRSPPDSCDTCATDIIPDDGSDSCFAAEGHR